MRRLYLILFIIIILAIVGGLAAYYLIFQQGEKIVPKLYFGGDKCDYCGMVIAKKAYAAAYYTIDGKWRKFDDIGCMFTMLDKEGMDKVKYIFVMDFNKLKWVDAKKAYYVKADPHDVWTPMSTGVVAFESLEDAKKFASQHNGKVYTFDQILKWFEEHPVMPMKM